jgi:hypothetical protein
MVIAEFRVLSSLQATLRSGNFFFLAQEANLGFELNTSVHLNNKSSLYFLFREAFSKNAHNWIIHNNNVHIHIAILTNFPHESSERIQIGGEHYQGSCNTIFTQEKAFLKAIWNHRTILPIRTVKYVPNS